MLRLLHIENIAVIEKCDIEFDYGFHVLTGETGAGKSIIIDAIGAILGERTTRELVRTGAQKALASAVFDGLEEEVYLWLKENGYQDEEESAVFIQREISLDGKNTCRVNGRPITVSMLKQLGTMLVNIHGQHDSQQLLDSAMHAMFIDRFAATRKYTGVIGKYCSCFEKLKQLKREKNKLDISETEKERRLEMLRYQIQELEDANLMEGEDETLGEQRAMLHSSARVIDALESAYALFNGGDELPGICGELTDAQYALHNASGGIDAMKELANRVNDLRYAAQDVAEEIRGLRDEMDFSPEEIERIETRFDLIVRLKRKYGNTVEEMLRYLEQAREELESIEFSQQKLAQLDDEIFRQEREAWALAEELEQLRRDAAADFEKRVMNELQQLDMQKVTLCVSITHRDSLDERGCDDIEFLISTNAGEPLKPLSKIASGGELSRIMLAFKNVLAQHDHVQTLVFDEVDAGVSGRAAQRVAEKLDQLAQCKQVLCVTHLAQLSAMADVHFKIEKSEQGGRTFTRVERLDLEGRVEELARITGGTQITETTRENARELLYSAQEIKRQRNLTK